MARTEILPPMMKKILQRPIVPTTPRKKYSAHGADARRFHGVIAPADIPAASVPMFRIASAVEHMPIPVRARLRIRPQGHNNIK